MSLDPTLRLGWLITMELHFNSGRKAARQEQRKKRQKRGAGIARPPEISADSMDMRNMRQAAPIGKAEMPLRFLEVRHG